MAARALRRRADLRRARPPHADPPAHRRSIASRPILPDFEARLPGGARLAVGHDARDARRLPIPAARVRLARGPGPGGAAGDLARHGDGRWPDAPRACGAWPLGTLFDPNIDRPLPFAGLSYVDFDVLGTGAQMSAFLAGPFAQVALSVPSVGGPGLQIQAWAFAALARYNDRSFRGGLERYDENLRQRPLRASVAAVRRLGARARLRAAYDLDAVRLDRRATRPRPTSACPPARSPTGRGPRPRMGARRLVGDGVGERGLAAALARVGTRRATSRRRRAGTSGQACRCTRSFVLSPAVRHPPGSDRPGRPRSRPLQPLRLRRLRQPAARIPVGGRSASTVGRCCGRAATWAARRVCASARSWMPRSSTTRPRAPATAGTSARGRRLETALPGRFLLTSTGVSGSRRATATGGAARTCCG